MIRFQDQAVGAAKMDFDQLGHVAEIGNDGHLRAIRTEREPDGVRRIMGNRESVHVDIADGEMLARLDTFDALEPLAKRFREDALHCIHGRFGDVERRFPDAQHLRQAVAVVGVLVGDQDAVNALDSSFDGREARQRFALAESGVHEEAGALGLEQSNVARAA